MAANNGAVQVPLYQPAMRVVTAITNANPASVTTSFAHNYINTDIVQFYMPSGFGMQQINGLVSSIVVTSPTTFTVNINTINFDPFHDPNNGQFAQVTPIAENNSTIYGATFNTAPSYQRNFVP
jgi:hypothetical protein